jgi:hypothetical protein
METVCFPETLAFPDESTQRQNLEKATDQFLHQQEVKRQRLLNVPTYINTEDPNQVSVVATQWVLLDLSIGY